jgi:hypothetical protein
MQLPVTISGHDLNGLAFVDQCSTTAIAPNGAIVMIARNLAGEQELFIRHGSRELLARVTGHSGTGNYGLFFVAPDPQFWGAALSPSGLEHGDFPEHEMVDPPTAIDPLLIPNCAQFDEPIPEKPAVRTGERRRSARITLRQAKVCIELPDGHQEIVELLNVSRGGVGFRSDKAYPLTAWVRVAAPFTPGSTNLFVPARIVRISRDAVGRIYGAEYIR